MGNTLDHPCPLSSYKSKDWSKDARADGLYTVPARPKAGAGRWHVDALLQALGFDDDRDDRTRNGRTVAVIGRLLPASGNYQQAHILALVRSLRAF
jgi:hypothetical protein